MPLSDMPPRRRWLAWFLFVSAVTALAVLARSPRDQSLANQAEIWPPPPPPAPPAAPGDARAASLPVHAVHQHVTGLHGEVMAAEMAAMHQATRAATATATTAAASTAAAAASTAAAVATRPSRAAAQGPGIVEERSWPAPQSGRFRLSLDRGDVTVVEGPVETVRIALVLDRDRGATDPGPTWREIQHDDGSLAIEIEARDGPRSGMAGFARVLSGRGGVFTDSMIRSVRVELPPGTVARIETGLGNLTCADAALNLHVETGAGDVTLERVRGDAQVETGAGDVRLISVSRSVEVATGAGDVTVEDAREAVQVQTGAGSVSVTGSPGSVRIEVGMGQVSVRTNSLRERLSIETGMGEIDLAVLGPGFELDAETGLASIFVDDGGKIATSSGLGARVQRRVGSGGPAVRLESGGGAIRVRRQPASDGG